MSGADTELPTGYREPELAGSGGSAVVYRCRDASGEVVAVKLFAQPLQDPTGGADEFRSECRTAAELSVHSGVIGVRAAGVTVAARPWLAMEYAHGGTVADRIREDGPLPVDRALALIAPVADTVSWAHTLLPSPVIHGDLKPSNILLDDAGRPKLSDFGVAKRLGARHSVTIAQFTQSYAAPEVLSDGRASVSADVWALAATLFEMLTGTAPFVPRPGEGPLPFMMRVQHGLPDDAIPASVPPAVVEILRSGLVVDRSRRTPTAAAFAAAVRSAQQSLGLAPTPPLPTPTSAPGRELRFVAYAEAVALTTASPVKLEPASTPAAPPAPRTRRPALIVAGAIGTLLLLAGAGIAFAVSGSPGPDAVADPTHAATQTPTATATPGPTATSAAATPSSTHGTGGVVKPGGGGPGGGGPGGGGSGPTAAPTTPSYGPITGLSITTSASGTTVSFTVSVNPNGKSATVHITTSLQSQTFITGTGAWSWSGSDNIGYSATDTINVTVSDPGRTTVTGQASRSTGAAPPPPPSVSMAKGPSAPSGFWYAITLQHFAADANISVTCHDSVDPGGFISFTLHTDGSGNAFTQSKCYSGDHPEHWATANGVQSNHVSW